MLKKFFTFRWILLSLVVLALAAVMIRLGFWQLDRLRQRREINAFYTAQMAMSPVNLNGSTDLPGLDGMDFRPAMVTGAYNFAEQVVLRNKAWQGQPGGHLLTPLRISGTNAAVIVDRGWVPLTDIMDNHLDQYNEPGVVEIRGAIRLSQDNYPAGSVVDPRVGPGKERLAALNLVNLERLKQQVSEELLPIFIQEQASPASTGLPYRVSAEPDLTEGPHLGYAIQWFSFAGILLIGFPFFIRVQLITWASRNKLNEKL
jgi:surfeit locus 1 family protein